MPYDPNLDKMLASEEAEFETTKITVGVYSYNDGEKKLQLSRQNRNKDGEWSFAKLGRMTKEEVVKVLPLISKVAEQL